MKIFDRSKRKSNCKISLLKFIFCVLCFLLILIAITTYAIASDSSNIENEKRSSVKGHQDDMNSNSIHRITTKKKKTNTLTTKERGPKLTIIKAQKKLKVFKAHNEKSTTMNGIHAKPSKCTSKQKTKILNQLSSNHCIDDKNQPFEQQCSLTKATKCPKATWLTSYYENISRKKGGEFIAVYVGCNKGYDAVNALRMGTGNSKYSKNKWKEEFRETYDNVCSQNTTEFVHVLTDEDSSIINGRVYCIEPMVSNFDRLNSSAYKLGWQNNLIVTKAAISKQNKKAYFRNAVHSTGRENWGLENNCEKLKSPRNPWHHAFKHVCDLIDVYTLDQYMKNNVASHKKKTNDKIHILSIDVEGFDYDVLLGGFNSLRKTEYLEFEYNWMGSWATQKLSTAIDKLDKIGFTCYWAGIDMLWRIDDSCWLEHYNFHTWSNIACVNRLLSSELASSMEEVFLRTVEEDVSY